MSERRGLVRTTLLLLPVQLVFRVGEAILPLLLAYWFGRSHATDVYNFAWAVFMFAGSLVFSAYHDSAVVPILAEAKLRAPETVPRITGSLLAHTWLFGGALAAVFALLATGYFRLRYDADDFRLAALMVPAFALHLVVMSTKTFFAALLSSNHTFTPYPVASAAGISVLIGFVAATRERLGVLSVPVGALLGEILAATILAFVAIRLSGLAPKLTLERPEPVRRFAKLVASEVGGGAVTRINPVVDQLMATLTGLAGGATLLRYSNDVASVPTSVLQAAFLSVFLAHVSDDFAGRDLERVRRTVARAVLSIAAMLAAASVLLHLVRRPVLLLIFRHGEMDAEGVLRMANIFSFHLVGLAGFGVLLVLSRAHIAIQNSRIMFPLGALNAGLNVALNIVLVRVLGVEGIALSTSLVHTLVALVFWLLFQRRVKQLAAEALP